jgi:hypothetical protein
LYLEFDVNGPSITNNSINLYYKIDDLTSDVLTKTYYKIDSYTGIGQNVVTLDFNDTFFTPEGIYSIELVLCEQNPSEITLTKDNSYSIKKLIIASHIFSDFVPDVNNFENITFDD